MEVDAYDTSMGADQRRLPCVFFSPRLTPKKRNYDTEKRELLALALALQEWRHWLEFVIWTDHTNLAYLRSAT